MKGKVACLSIIGLILLAAGIVMYFYVPTIAPGVAESIANPDNLFNLDMLTTSLQGLFKSPLLPANYIMFGIAGLLVVLLLIDIVVIIAKKHALGLLETLGYLIGSAAILWCGLILFIEEGYCQIYSSGAKFSDGGYVGAIIANFSDLGAKDALLGLIAPLLMLVGAILVIVAVIVDMAYMGSLEIVRKPKKIAQDASVYSTDALYAHEVNEEEPKTDEAAPAAKSPDVVAVPGGSAVSGPLLVQYINTYSPDAAHTKATPSSERALTAEEIRQIIHDELRREEKPEPKQPVIVAVPSPAPAAEKAEPAPTLTHEEVRQIVSEEIKASTPVDDVVVEPEPEPALTAEDVKRIIAEALSETKKVEEKPAEPEPVDIRAIIKEELSAYREEEEKKAAAKKEAEEKAKADEEARLKIVEEARKEALEQLRKEAEEKAKAQEEEARKQAEAEKAEEEKRLADEKHEALLKQLEDARKAEEARRAEEEKKPVLTADNIREIVADELSKLSADKEGEDITADLIRTIVRQEVQAAAPIKEEKIAPVTVVVKEPEPEPEPEPAPEPEPKPEPKPEPEPAPAPTPHITVVVNNPAPAPTPAPAPVEEKKPEPVKRVVGAINPDLPPHDKIIRIPFPTRMVDADKDMKSNYNELKSEILSYGVKSRVSNSGDTFRLHKITFVKITIAGKSLKLYFALDPKEYANSTYPVQDVSHKNIYKDIPMVFKVKSELSMRRAKQLIADVMDKHGLEQGKIIPHNYAADLKDYVPTGGGASDEEDDD